MKGGSLFDKVANKRKFDEREAARIIKSLMEVLEYMHAKNILHRDIKLENILLPFDDNDTLIKLADFDLASPIAEINHSKQCGTPGYMAPEVFYQRFGGYSPKTDVFSSGIVLYAL